ncbi:MAG: hypothetical protein IJT54_05105 [Candidatus Methanomethylophilaceae archaeon]|nr:hypothetical protein [Candidatus Methanomethylophilaceae archaeon]
MIPLCATCQHRVKEIRYVGFSTVAWTGKYQCDRQYQEHDWKLRYDAEDKLHDLSEPTTEECADYAPSKSRGQTSLEVWI